MNLLQRGLFQKCAIALVNLGAMFITSVSLSEKVMDAIAAISDRPIRFVINTHWHSDRVNNPLRITLSNLLCQYDRASEEKTLLLFQNSRV